MILRPPLVHSLSHFICSHILSHPLNVVGFPDLKMLISSFLVDIPTGLSHSRGFHANAHPPPGFLSRLTASLSAASSRSPIFCPDQSAGPRDSSLAEWWPPPPFSRASTSTQVLRFSQLNLHHSFLPPCIQPLAIPVHPTTRTIFLQQRSDPYLKASSGSQLGGVSHSLPNLLYQPQLPPITQTHYIISHFQMFMCVLILQLKQLLCPLLPHGKFLSNL